MTNSSNDLDYEQILFELRHAAKTGYSIPLYTLNKVIKIVEQQRDSQTACKATSPKA